MRMQRSLAGGGSVARAAFLIAASLLLAGCSWFGRSGGADRPAPLADIPNEQPVRTVWRADVGSSRGAFLQPALAENAVFVANADGAVVRIAADSGAVAWRTETGARLSAGAGSDGFTVAVGTPRGEVIALDAGGKVRWRAQASSDIASAPLVGRGVVVVRSSDHRITAFNADDGKRRWVYQRVQPPLSLRAATDLAFAGDNVVVGFPGGQIVAVALSNGAARWEATVSDPRGATEVERLADVVGTLAVSSREVCAGSFQGRLACFDPSSGTQRWSRSWSARGGVAADEQGVIAVDVRSHIGAFTREGGAGVWRNERLAARGLGAPAIARGVVALGDSQGYVHFLSRASGDLIARTRPDSSPVTAPPRPVGDRILVQTQAGAVVLLAVGR